MKTSRFKPRISISSRVECLSECMHFLLNHLNEDSAKEAMCSVIVAEAVALQEELQHTLDSYRQKLPLYHERPDIVWREIIKNLGSLMTEIRMQDLSSDTFGLLQMNVLQLQDLMRSIEQTLHPLTDSDKFAEYGKREHERHSREIWDYTTLDCEFADYEMASSHEFYQKKAAAEWSVLENCLSNAIDINQRIVYYEPLGHKLWAATSETELKQILDCICRTEFFSRQSGLNMTFLDSRIASVPNPNDDSMTPEQLSHQRLLQKRDLLRSQNLDNVKQLTNRVCHLYKKGLTVDWVNKMLDAMFQDDDLAQEICDKMSDNSKLKTVHGLMGELKEYYSTQSVREIVNAFPCNNLTNESRERYVRAGLGDCPLRSWVHQYIAIHSTI